MSLRVTPLWQGYLQAMKVGRSSDGALVGELNGLRHLDRTMRWDAGLEQKISSLTTDQIGAALRRHIDPKKLVIVNAGDFEKASEAKKPTGPAAAATGPSVE